MPYTTPILLTGDQVASLTGSPYNQGNPGDANFGMVLPGVDALAGPETTYRLVWQQNVNQSSNEFSNGQGWRLEVYTGTSDPATDASGWTAVPGYSNLNPKNDLVSGVGGGDDYIVFDAGGSFLVYDIRGALPTAPTTLIYPGAAQNGDLATGDNDSQLDFTDAYSSYQPICFCAGTLINTKNGPVPIERLTVGDLVVTLDHGLQPIRWIGRRDVSLAESIAHSDILPVRLAAGSMGRNMPQRDLWLSPQHRVLVRSKIAERMTGAAEALVAVKHLCGLAGIAQINAPRKVTYLHLRLDRHEVILAEGLWAETLLVGPEALKAMGPAARRELRHLFPGLIEGPKDAARVLVPGRAARQLAARHRKNEKALVDS
jgi:hypothetical protein